MKRLKVVIAVGISLALLIYLARSVDSREVSAQLSRTHWGWVAAAAAAGIAGLFCRAARWRYLFAPDARPPALEPAMMIGYMANNVLPLRAGEFVRVYVVARRWRHGFWTALATLVVERVLDSLALVLILGVLVLLIPVPAFFRNAALVVLAIDIAGVLVLGWLTVYPDAGRRVIGRLGRRWPVVERRLGGVYERFVQGLDGIRSVSNARPLMAWTAIVWLMPALAAWTTLRAVDLHLPFLAGWVVLAFVGLGISIPAAPGYIGIYHFAAAKAVEIFGLSPSAAVAYAIVLHATQFVPVTVVGWLFLVREGLSLGEATHARPPASDALPPS